MLSFSYVALLDPDLVINKWYRYAVFLVLLPSLYAPLSPLLVHSGQTISADAVALVTLPPS